MPDHSTPGAAAKEEGRSMSDAELDRILREVLIRKGLLIPCTVREVLIMEEEFAKESPSELPERLRDPYELMRRHPEVFGRDIVKRRDEG